MYPYSSLPADESEVQWGKKAEEIDMVNKSPMGTGKKPYAIDKKALDLIECAIQDEKNDYEHYGKLINMAKSDVDAEIIRQIRLDEHKHLKVLTELYYKLSGRRPNVQAEHSELRLTVLDEYEKAIFHEIEGSEFYRKIYFVFSNLEIRDMIYEIMTDETAHSTKFNYLYSKNK